MDLLDADYGTLARRHVDRLAGMRIVLLAAHDTNSRTRHDSKYGKGAAAGREKWAPA